MCTCLFIPFKFKEMCIDFEFTMHSGSDTIMDKIARFHCVFVVIYNAISEDLPIFSNKGKVDSFPDFVSDKFFNVAN